MGDLIIKNVWYAALTFLVMLAIVVGTFFTMVKPYISTEVKREVEEGIRKHELTTSDSTLQQLREINNFLKGEN